MKWKAWINGILGLWLSVSVFLHLGSTAYILNDIGVGLIIVLLSFSIIHDKSWIVWIAGIIALWLICASFIPYLVKGIGLYFNNIIVGLFFLIAGFIICAHAERLPQQSRFDKHYSYLYYGGE